MKKMSTGDWFTLVPLSNFFVRKTTGATPDPNLGTIQPIASGNVTGTNITGGTYSWYQVFHFGGTPNTQGVELKTYALVVRGFSTSSGSGNTNPIPLPQAFDNNFKIYKLFYDTLSTFRADYTASVNSTSSGIVVNATSPSGSPINNDGFMFLVWGF
jgi:hypothetical protein